MTAPVVAPIKPDRNKLSLTISGVNFTKTLGIELATLADVERIEVLKCPQCMLFGRNTTDGALSITAKLPSDVF